MKVHSPSEIWLNAVVTLNDGTKATVVDDHQNHEMVVVNQNGNDFPILVGEAFRPDLDPLWIDSIDPDDNPQDEEPPHEAPNNYLNEIFDGYDPHTFDGDILDLA